MARFGKIGWLFGLIFGALFGVLFAPRRGKDLRAKMKRERKEGKLGVAPLQSDIKQIVSDVSRLAKDFYESEKMADMIEKGKETFKDVSGKVKEGLGEARDSLLDAIKSEQQLGHKVEFEKHEMNPAPRKKPRSKRNKQTQ